MYEKKKKLEYSIERDFSHKKNINFLEKKIFFTLYLLSQIFFCRKKKTCRLYIFI